MRKPLLPRKTSAGKKTLNSVNLLKQASKWTFQTLKAKRESEKAAQNLKNDIDFSILFDNMLQLNYYAKIRD